MSSRKHSSELARSSTDLVLLTLLGAKPMYGYEILTTLAERGSGEFHFKQGTLYPLLYRLEREGWIRARWETPANGKKRKIYSLTRDGRKVQQARAEAWRRFTTSINRILDDYDS